MMLMSSPDHTDAIEQMMRMSSSNDTHEEDVINQMMLISQNKKHLYNSSHEDDVINQMMLISTPSSPCIQWKATQQSGRGSMNLRLNFRRSPAPLSQK